MTMCHLDELHEPENPAALNADIAWLEWLLKVEAATGLDVNGYQLGHAYIAHRNGVTASDYALEVVARAGEFV